MEKPKLISLRVYFGVLLYDSLLVIGLLFVATIVYMLPYFLNSDVDSSQNTNLSTSVLQSAMFKTYLFSIWFSFLAWFWTRGGQTLGLKAWKARVERSDASPLSLWYVLIRFFSSLAPWLVALFLYHLAGKTGLITGPHKYWILLIGFSSIIWSFFDKDGLSLHDRFSETHIVKVV
jgi:uncharacterized RDD family membrane protein YckC